jgi:2-polyprenyl-3-methyl-5-hydroxy-6-metoxy-1,4-benzoquinol methylase
VLRPGGVVALSTPNPRGLSELAKRVLRRSRRLRSRFYGSYHDQQKTRVLPSGDVMVDALVTRQELERSLSGSGLAVVRSDYIVFVSKFLPSWLLAPAKAAEWILERVPFIRRLASTSVYLARKAD